MYRDVTILIVSAKWEDAEALDHALSSYRFQIIRASSFMAALRSVGASDIMFLDWCLPNGQADQVLTYWLRNARSGPVCVLENGLSGGQRNELMRKAWSVLSKPVDAEDVPPVAQRFAQGVRGQRALREIPKLRRWLVVLSIVVAGLGGTEIVWPLVKLLMGG